jgi:FKBP-type peptidyl-prolyl cis-trans isomerase FkpA
MKTKITLVLVFAMALAFTGCKSYKKTKSGLVYKIFPASGKDSLIKAGDIVKFHFTRKLNDSVLYSSYGKMPSYIPLQNDPGMDYSPVEVFFLAKKGDSLVTIEMMDTLIKKGATQQLPPNIKKGDRLTTYIKILEVYKSDSLARKDVDIELGKDRPRQEKEMKERDAKEGVMEKEVEMMQAFLTSKKINAQKTNDGTFVTVKEKGNGDPVLDGKYVVIKYTGKFPETDSVFESNVYTFKLGTGVVIRGWDDGLKLFNVGGNGTLYIPAYMAWGKNPGPGNKTNQPVIFDVKVLSVADTEKDATDAAAKVLPPPPPPKKTS